MMFGSIQKGIPLYKITEPIDIAKCVLRLVLDNSTRTSNIYK